MDKQRRHYPDIAPTGPTHVRAVRCGDFLFTSGCTALNTPAQGGTLVEQSRATLDKIKRIVEREGRTMADVVKLTTYVTRMQEYRDTEDAINAVWAEVFEGDAGRIDFGVRALEVVPGKDGQQIMFRHEGLASPMPLIYESHGTRQFLKLFPLITYVLSVGSIAIIDELDAAVHPMLLPEIIGWFHDPVRNPHNAQLWTSCHNVSLLEELSKEEIVFCEKDWQGRTEIYALSDVKGVRRDENYYKKYLGGVFGAVPRLG